MLALCSSSRRTIACSPNAAAKVRAVVSRRTMACWPSAVSASWQRAVRSLAPRRSTLAPRFSSSFATHKCPPFAAACSSPRLFSSSSASTCPPFSSHSTTNCSSPRYAAPAIAHGNDDADAWPGARGELQNMTTEVNNNYVNNK
eukprot:scaffold113110_cov63-Phaeocystis_antarctica.AAC.4